jgi:hypothetical protein
LPHMKKLKSSLESRKSGKSKVVNPKISDVKRS